MRRLLVVSGVLGLLTSCNATTPSTSVASASLTTALTVASPSGCRVDDDCTAQTFCFQGTCVSECMTDANCPSGAQCSPRARCIVGELDAGKLDEASASVSATDAPTLTLQGWPDDSNVEVATGAPFVALKLRSATPVPEGRLLYTVRPEGGAPQVFRAEGSTEFTLTLPTGTAGSDAAKPQVIQVVTPSDTHTLYLVPTRPRAGLYAGTFTPAVFGGAGLPLEFVVQTEPATVMRLSDASKAWVWLPTSPSSLIALARPGETASWVRRPLSYDATLGVWVALFAEEFDPAPFVGSGAFELASRAVRLELSVEDGSTLQGAIADRWRGLYDVRNADGVRAPGLATVSGQFSVDRVRSLPATSSMREGAFAPPPAPQQPKPSLTECTAAMFVVPIGVGQTESACKDVGDVATFAAADASRRSRCALGVAGVALSGTTVGSQLRALIDPTIPDPVGVTFKSFIEACANEASTTCKPTPTLRCARALVASAYLDADAASSDVQRLSQAYDATTQEAFLGRQLAAFQVDTQTRLDWLQKSEAPAFLASTLRDYNTQILNTWRSKVLDAHLAGVFGQLDAAGLAVLTRSPTDPVALSNRQSLLLDLSNSWRAAMDALVLLTSRWNVLLQDDLSRSRAAGEIRLTAQRLYVTAAILQELARESGSGALSASFGAGFSVLHRELNRLAMPFDVLLFARDAEVVTSTSLDPKQDSATLLKERESAARAAVSDALASVDLVLADAQKTAVDTASLTARYEDQLLSLRNELISLCGLPAGCTASEVDATAACSVPTAAGRCGFVTPRGGVGPVSDAESVSEAGSALSSLREAAAAGDEAQGRLDALTQETNLMGSTTIAFAGSVENWNRQRRQVAKEVEVLLGEIAQLNDARIDAAVASARSQQALREQAYKRQEAALSNWSSIRDQGIEADLTKMNRINSLQIASSVLGLSADRIDLFAQIFKDASPKQVGLSTDPSFVARLSVRFPAAIASTALLAGAEVLNDTSAALKVQLENAQALREAQLTTLEQLPDLDALAVENDLAAITSLVETTNLSSEKATHSLKALVDALKRNLALDLAYDKDLVELRDRRDAWRLKLVDLLRLQYGVTQAQLTARQRELAYYQVVQRAQLLEGRYRSMQTRFSNLESLLGSPDVLFSFAGRMARAESRIDRARAALERWLIALEYYSVRPFVDQRLAILLARNPSQLEAIANEFVRLQNVCGGPVTSESVNVSLRDDLLGVGFATLQRDGTTASAAERFRAVLGRAQTPVNRRVPFSPTQTVGQRLSQGHVLAASFSLGVEQFANLARTCNTKLDSISVQLVGAGFSGQPVVSVVYDGASQLRSCQPGIDTLVKALGPGTTAFAKVTPFKTSGRTISPVAGVDTLGSANATLQGLPLTAGYTVLIDLDHPSNRGLPWQQLEDVRLQFNYSYQDVFPQGQCQ